MKSQVLKYHYLDRCRKIYSWIRGFVIFHRNRIFSKNHVLESCFKSHFEIIFWDQEYDFLCKNCSNKHVICIVSSFSYDLSLQICRKWSQMLILQTKSCFQNVISKYDFQLQNMIFFMKIRFCLNHGASYCKGWQKEYRRIWKSTSPE